MRTTKHMLTTGLMATALLAAGFVISIPSAHAYTRMDTSGATAQVISTGSTGSAELDDLCRQAAELITNAERERDAALLRGDDEAVREWGEHAINMRQRAEGWGCSFMNTRVNQSGPRAPRGGTAAR